MHIAVAIILRDAGGTVLLTRRAQSSHMGGLWEFPGGKVEPHETPADTCVRETNEETALTVVVVEQWDTVTFQYETRTVTLHPFLCRAQSDMVQLNGPTEYAWAALDELNTFPMPAANSAIVHRLQTQSSSL